ncbi:MAG: hypothetical protein MUQ32_06690, partial [Chloroflexi bacterium]|nr:hypothetical protein [Chloroflexota bacterium]
MPEPFSEIPAYLLVLPVFWGAFAVFGLVVARHLRVFHAVRTEGPRALSEVPLRIHGLGQYAIVQTRMFRDRRAGIMHLGLFLSSTILLIGNFNMVTIGIPQTILSWPLDGIVWTLLVAIQ